MQEPHAEQYLYFLIQYICSQIQWNFSSGSPTPGHFIKQECLKYVHTVNNNPFTTGAFLEK